METLNVENERVLSEGRMYRRPTIRANDPWLYFCSYGEAMVIGDPLETEGIVTGPIQVRCLRHGWATTGVSDVCGRCAEEVESVQRAEQEDLYELYLDRIQEQIDLQLTHLSA